MKCPKCQCDMVEGDATIHTTILGFLIYDWFSWQWLWFYPEDKNRKVRKIICSSETAPAHECPQCGAVLVEKGFEEGRIRRCC